MCYIVYSVHKSLYCSALKIEIFFIPILIVYMNESSK